MAATPFTTYRLGNGFGETEVLNLREQVASLMNQSGVDGNTSYTLINVLDEFCCNLMEHSQANWVEIELSPQASHVAAVLKDDGVAFDSGEAIARMDPDRPSHVSDRRLGLYMIGILATDLAYRREGNVNRLEFSLKR